jgi:hypothetical protein
MAWRAPTAGGYTPTPDVVTGIRGFLSFPPRGLLDADVQDALIRDLARLDDADLARRVAWKLIANARTTEAFHAVLAHDTLGNDPELAEVILRHGFCDADTAVQFRTVLLCGPAATLCDDARADWRRLCVRVPLLIFSTVLTATDPTTRITHHVRELETALRTLGQAQRRAAVMTLREKVRPGAHTPDSFTALFANLSSAQADVARTLASGWHGDVDALVTVSTQLA